MIEEKNYWYDGQLRQYMLQFMSIFYGLQVQTGVQACGTPTMVSVPTVYGSKDRVVAAAMSGNTQNRSFALPIMATNILGMTIDDARRRATDVEITSRFMPATGVFPDDLRSVTVVSPVAYALNVELAIYASNTQQLHQILEQILVLFNPDFQLQVSNGPMDLGRITSVILTDIASEENYPVGGERRIVSWTLQFTIPIYLSVPVAIKNDIVRRVRIRLGTVNTDGTGGFADDEGNWVPMNEIISDMTFDQRPPEGPEVRPQKPIPGTK